jgi:uncharacterized membrane protein YhiD involved in acid resistance
MTAAMAAARGGRDVRARRLALGLLVLWLLPASARPVAGQTPAQPDLTSSSDSALSDTGDEFRAVAVRLPLAALLGCALALRPRRRSSRPREMSVVETQIILAMVGALVMLVVGASLARAFGIVGAANLIRYRAKVDDTKDAVVMLSALGVGLASGVGLYVLATMATLMIGVALWIIEGFEPAVYKHFELTIDAKQQIVALRPRIEGILRRFKTQYEMRAASADRMTYVVAAPTNARLDRISAEIVRLGEPDRISVEWDQQKPKKENIA